MVVVHAHEGEYGTTFILVVSPHEVPEHVDCLKAAGTTVDIVDELVGPIHEGIFLTYTCLWVMQPVILDMRMEQAAAVDE